MSDHLEAVSRREILRLIINIPPRNMKSLETNVFWPAWHWLRDPSHQFLFSSYAAPLTIRDSVRCRRIIQSRRYQAILKAIGATWKLTGDQNAKERYENTENGARIASSVGGALTGEGGDTIVVDDPHNTVNVDSLAKVLTTLQWWDEAMSTRLNDQKTGAYVLIMQRQRENDLTGHILAKEMNWDHLCLPARYEGNRVVSSIGFKDWRTEIDEPLWPERFGDAELKDLEISLGSYAAAGQLQQRPAPRGGGQMKIEMFADRMLKEMPGRSEIVGDVRYWDKAATEGGTGARTAGVRLIKLKDQRVVIVDVVKGRWSSGSRNKRMLQVAHEDGINTHIWVEQEPGSGGKESAEISLRDFMGFIAHADKVTGAKEVRAEGIEASLEAGNVWMLTADWNAEFLDEGEHFPTGKTRDQWDAAGGAFNKMHLAKRAGTFGKRMHSRGGKRRGRRMPAGRVRRS